MAAVAVITRAGTVGCMTSHTRSLALVFGVLSIAALSCSGASDVVITEPVAVTSENEPTTAAPDAETNVQESPAAAPAEPEQAENAAPEEAVTRNVGEGLFPTVVNATATSSNETTWQFNVTLLSEYDSPERYADAWRVLDGNDVELGIRVLGHDHANEQPFTRSTSVEVPVDVTLVFVEGRDQVNGWSGERFEVVLTR